MFTPQVLKQKYLNVDVKLRQAYFESTMRNRVIVNYKYL